MLKKNILKYGSLYQRIIILKKKKIKWESYTTNLSIA